MKVTRNRPAFPPFVPITIKIETEDEAIAIWNALNSCAEVNFGLMIQAKIFHQFNELYQPPWNKKDK